MIGCCLTIFCFHTFEVETIFIWFTQVKSEPTDRDVSGTPPFVSDPSVQVECGAGDSPNVVPPSTNHDSSGGEPMQMDQFPVKTEPVPTEENSPLVSSANTENSGNAN